MEHNIDSIGLVVGQKIALKELLKAITSTITPLYDEREALSVARLLLRDMFGIDRVTAVMEPERELDVSQRLRTAIEELAQGRPIQYVLGKAPFYGLDFVVREGVLIPRPETEELLKWMLNSTSEGERILDIGTGSGAIAITLALRVLDSEVRGIDISAQALEVAAINAERHGARVEFMEVDVLSEIDDWTGEWRDGEWGVVVSNPPYIPRSQMATMHPNVTQYEPHEALFVDDRDPLIFYRVIAERSTTLLRSGGLLYFELHEEYADAVLELLEQMEFTDLRLMQDINGKKRALRCRKR